MEGGREGERVCVFLLCMRVCMCVCVCPDLCMCGPCVP
jgi:hypothetical protein